jgi:hypothetical protein
MSDETVSAKPRPTVSRSRNAAIAVILSGFSVSCGSIEGDVHATSVGGTEVPLAFQSVQIIPAAAVKAPLDSACKIFAKSNAPMVAKSDSFRRVMLARAPISAATREASFAHDDNARAFENAMSRDLDDLTGRLEENSVSTDASGHFRSGRLSPGEHFVQTRHRTGPGPDDGLFLRRLVQVPLIGTATTDLSNRDDVFLPWSCADTSYFRGVK